MWPTIRSLSSILQSLEVLVDHFSSHHLDLIITDHQKESKRNHRHLLFSIRSRISLGPLVQNLINNILSVSVEIIWKRFTSMTSRIKVISHLLVQVNMSPQIYSTPRETITAQVWLTLWEPLFQLKNKLLKEVRNYPDQANTQQWR